MKSYSKTALAVSISILSALFVHGSAVGREMTKGQAEVYKKRIVACAENRDYKGVFKIAKEFHHEYGAFDVAKAYYRVSLCLAEQSGLFERKDDGYLGEICGEINELYNKLADESGTDELRKKYKENSFRFYEAACVFGDIETIRSSIASSVELYEENRHEEYSVIHGESIAVNLSPRLKLKYPRLYEKAVAIVKEVFGTRGGCPGCETLQDVDEKRKDKSEKAIETLKEFTLGRM